MEERRKNQVLNSELLEEDESPGSYYGDDSLELVTFNVKEEQPLLAEGLEKEGQLPLLRDLLPNEHEEVGEDVREVYNESLKSREWSKIITKDLYKDCHDPNQVLEEIWSNFKIKPRRYVGGRHLSWLSRFDYQVRVGLLPRPIWIDLGQRLDYNYIQSQLELEFKDYVEEVERIERGLRIRDITDPCERRLIEAKVRQECMMKLEDPKIIDSVIREKGVDLIPFAEDKGGRNKLHKGLGQGVWISYSADGLVPFLYNNSYISSNNKLTFQHQNPREIWEKSLLYSLDPLNFEDLSPDRLSLSEGVINNLNITSKRAIHLGILGLERLINSRRTRLSQDELLLFGFNVDNISYKPNLELFERNYLSPFIPKLQDLSQHEFEIWKQAEVFVIPTNKDD